MVMFVDPSWLTEVICVTAAMRLNMRSSGVATAVAIVSGLAPGKLAETVIVGYSTAGKRAIGKNRNASAPKSSSAMLKSEVATGLLINGSDTFIGGGE